MRLDAKEYLEQYQKAKRKIERLKWTIEELGTLAEGGSIKLDGLPHGSGMKSPMEHFLAKKIDTEKKLKNQIEYAQDILVEIEKTIDKVDNPELGMLLHYRYIEGLQFETNKIFFNKTKSNAIKDKLGYSTSYIYEMHNKALDEVQKLIN